MNVQDITPLILTYNEEANLDRTLNQLTWASRILLVDSYSTDATLDIAYSYPQVDVVQREFDDFASQCNFGLGHVDATWVLSLDADYVCSDDLIDEIQSLPTVPENDGFSVEFVYCIFGEPLRGTLYPPRTVLYRRSQAKYRQDGHGHHVQVDGSVVSLDSCIYHDDRKPLGTWLRNQRRYSHNEADKLTSGSASDLADRLRQTRLLAPFLTLLYCLFGKGLILDGWPGWYYTLQRTYAEILLALELIDRDLRPE